jgi:hypothetical protein
VAQLAQIALTRHAPGALCPTCEYFRQQLGAFVANSHQATLITANARSLSARAIAQGCGRPGEQGELLGYFAHERCAVGGQCDHVS